MGVVNVTPDSFSEQYHRADPVEAINYARRLAAEGADILDIGGESTRPGAPAVPVAEELARVLPVLDALRDCGVPLSVDTRKPEVMREALAHGADIINDVGGFTAGGAIDAVAQSSCGLCVMHMQGDPSTMQQSPSYGDVVAEVEQFLAGQSSLLQSRGIERDRIVLDPGVGFGKTLEHNLALLRSLPRLAALGPLLVGVSRKSFIGRLTGKEVHDRMAGSLAAMLAVAQAGAAIVRVHDVAAARDALTVWQALVAEQVPEEEHGKKVFRH
jgi:dihydropteroate synthase